MKYTYFPENRRVPSIDELKRYAGKYHYYFQEIVGPWYSYIHKSERNQLLIPTIRDIADYDRAVHRFIQLVLDTSIAAKEGWSYDQVLNDILYGVSPNKYVLFETALHYMREFRGYGKYKGTLYRFRKVKYKGKVKEYIQMKKGHKWVYLYTPSHELIVSKRWQLVPQHLVKNT